MVFSYLVLLLCLIALFNTQPVSCSTAYTLLAQGQTMADINGTSLVSPGNIFEFGFFSPGRNSTSRYVGIRYLNVSTPTFLWVANRESPLLNDSGTITITGGGDLVVHDGGGANIVWSTKTSSWRNSNSTAQLYDSGNLILHAADGSVLWQSFDHPADTFVPGMKLVLDLNTGENQLLTAWNTPSDPSAGKYSLGLDPKGSAQLFIWEGSVLRWRSGQWNRQTFIGTMMRPLYLYGFKLTNDTGTGLMYLTFDYYNSSILRFSLQPDGVENTTMLNNNNKEWVSVWGQPLNECELYGTCGENGLCALDTNGSPSCSCLRGFDPRAEDDWNRGNWSGGCVRRTRLGCQLMNGSDTSSNGDEDGFFMLQGLKLPDLSDWISSITNEDDCSTFCKNSCGCRAYAYPDGIGCLTWDRDLVDSYKFPPPGSDDLYTGNDIYIKLAGSELATNKIKLWKILVIVFSFVLAIVIISMFLCWKYNAIIKDCYSKSRNHISFKSSLRISQQVRTDFSGPSEPGECPEGKGSELPLFSFESLAAATGNFSNENKLGQGGFGIVYKGILPEGQEIAVKRLSAGSGQGADEFKNEVILIAKLQHRNLVRLTGCCIQGEEKMLVYEYMPNKSLDTFLFEASKQELLDWEKRFDIIEGIARGLVYLHRDSRLRIIHRDLKASNILLDEHMKPKISDFGMARIFGSDENQANTNRLVGTYGYMSPEYAMEGLFSVKSDVYSFGVLVLEIVAGRRNNSFHHTENTMNIVTHAWQLWSSGKATELIDPAIRASCSTSQVVRCINIALLCVQDQTNDRPDMSSVVIMLGSESASYALPKQPKFTMVEIKKQNKGEEGVSINDVTITVVEGR